ncbi:protogenin-like isoform X2 [Ptychodera flava]|uniref:protogenin-like isoform X2 n=1 Tax=Ptychodera flava TaxID=63121 RepID=UPI003969E2BE
MAHQPSVPISWLTLFLCVLLSTGVFSIETLKFTVEPHDVIIVTKNQPFVWECSAEGVPPIRITWKKDGQNIKNSVRNFVRNGSLYFSTIVHRKKQSDEGMYQCFASNEYGTIFSSAKLRVAEKPRITQQPQPVTAYIGNVTRLSCLSESLPQSNYTWEKDRVLLPESDRIIILPSGVLQIYDIQENDAGSYRCVAKNILSRRRSDEATLTVLPASSVTPTDDPERKPKIIAGPPSVIINREKENVILECLVARNQPTDPEPLITWKKNNNPIQSDRISIYGRSNLQIRDLQRSDSGIYACMAENVETDGVVFQHGTLQVQAPPVLTDLPQDLESRAGSTARFSCKADGEPVPTKSWFVNGTAVDYEGRYKQRNDDLVVSNIQREDGGLYQCVVENNAGRVHASALLQVIAGQDREPAPENVTGVAISSTTVRISWNHYSNDVIAFTVHYYENSGGTEETKPVPRNNNSYLVESLKPNTIYIFYVTAYDELNAGLPSRKILVRTLEAVPSAAPIFTLSSNNRGNIKVRWSPIPMENRNGVITKYHIYYYEGSKPDEVFIREVDGQLLEYEVTDLRPNTFYSIKMSAFTSAGEGVCSIGSVPIRTLGGDPSDQLKPDAPVNLKIRPVNSTAIELNWTEPYVDSSVSVKGYMVSYIVVRSESDSSFETEPIQLDNNKVSFVLSQLEPCTTYYFKLWAFNEHGNGPVTSSSAIQTPSCSFRQSDPPPPAGLRAVVRSSNSILIAWGKPQSRIKIVSFTVRFHPIQETNATLIRSEETNENHYSLENLIPFTRYAITVKAHGFNSESSFSPAISVQTLEDIPSPPSHLNAQLYGIQSVLLEWAPPEHPNGIITTYIIMYSWDMADPDDMWTVDEKEATMTRSVVDNLEPSLEYYFKMKAKTEVGVGPPTDPVPILIPASNKSHAVSDTTKIILGVCIGVMCILIIALVIYKKRHGLFQVCKPRTYHVAAPAWNGHVPSQSNGTVMEYGLPQSDMELESFSPMLSQLPAQSHIDSKGDNSYPNYYSQHGFQGSGGLPLSDRAQAELPGNSNMTTFAPTSGPGPRAPQVYSENTNKFSESSQPLLQDQSCCHDNSDERDNDADPEADVTSSSVDQCCSRTLPQCVNSFRPSLLSEPYENTGLLETASVALPDRLSAGALQNSSTQDHNHGSEDDNRNLDDDNESKAMATPPLPPPAAVTDDVPDSGNLLPEKLHSSAGNDTCPADQAELNKLFSHSQQGESEGAPMEESFTNSRQTNTQGVGDSSINKDTDKYTSFLSSV